MVRPPLTEQHLKRELAYFREKFPNLHDDELFVVWFLRAFVTEDEVAADAVTDIEPAVAAVVGGADLHVVVKRQRVGAFAELRLDRGRNGIGVCKAATDENVADHRRRPDFAGKH